MKLSISALKERAEAIVSEELLIRITGGIKEECHNGDCQSGDYDGDDIMPDGLLQI